jgi:hypothetical protein
MIWLGAARLGVRMLLVNLGFSPTVSFPGDEVQLSNLEFAHGPFRGR